MAKKRSARIIMAEIPSALGNITVINGYFPQGREP
ncbi:exodeoxyribonuclease III [Enterobacter cloacae]|uniref:Exodeoxyribonuclease III n=1 Tax=Enterobacter cloacae TaxID=550 RepID=A0A377M2Z5_ENTCL|nr:exodeoxyribonuclease III [Enterobacter cloacae]